MCSLCGLAVIDAGMSAKLGLLYLSGELLGIPFSEQMKDLVKQEVSILIRIA
jgi:hypothetical protein